MKVSEYRFTEYYHQYITIEADDLTELCKPQVEVTEEDCYALCSSWIDAFGTLHFNVLAIGPNYETCTKGLDKNEMLADFTIEQVAQCEARVAIKSYAMEEKNEPFLEEKDRGVNEDVLTSRGDGRLDDIRDVYYPDIVTFVEVDDRHVTDYQTMRIVGFRGPFLVGNRLLPDEEGELDDSNIYVYTVPCTLDTGDFCLAMICDTDKISSKDKEHLEHLIKDAEQKGLDFTGLHVLN